MSCAAPGISAISQDAITHSQQADFALTSLIFQPLLLPQKPPPLTKPIPPP